MNKIIWFQKDQILQDKVLKNFVLWQGRDEDKRVGKKKCYITYRMKVKMLENFGAKKGTHADLLIFVRLLLKQILL